MAELARVADKTETSLKQISALVEILTSSS